MNAKNYIFLSLLIVVAIVLQGCCKQHKDTSVAKRVVKNDVRTLFKK